MKLERSGINLFGWEYKMEMSLTQEQKNFIHGLKLFGCSKMQALVLFAYMWHPDDLTEMLNYMVNHLESTPEQLYEVCMQIASKRGDPPPYPED